MKPSLILFKKIIKKHKSLKESNLEEFLNKDL